MATSVIASAQFVTSGGSKSFGSSSSGEGYNSIRFSYAPTSITWQGVNIGGLMGAGYLNGFSFEYTKGIGIVEDIPLYLEIGAGVKWQNMTSKYEEEDEMYIYNSKTSLNVASLYIPLNIGYKISLTEDFAIMPYVGLMAQANLAATITDSYEYDYSKEYENWPWGGYEDESEKDSYSSFDKEEMDGQTLRRLIFGWQVGANVAIKNFHIGANCGTSLGGIINDMEGKILKGATISVGYNF